MTHHSKALQALYSLLSMDPLDTNDVAKLAVPSSATNSISRRSDPLNCSDLRFDSSEVSTPISGMSTINLLDSHAELGYMNWLSVLDRCDGNVIPHPIKGSAYDYLGCFPLGSTVSRQSFVDVVRSQQVSDIFDLAVQECQTLLK